MFNHHDHDDSHFPTKRLLLLAGRPLGEPIAQFAKWFNEAMKAQVNEPNAMSVATVGADGRPSSRIVLIKQYDERGFTWYTNYQSQKGQQLAANPHAAILFFWPELERQVRIEGRVEKTAEEESDKYFYSRPVKSQLAAIASQQSRPVASREQMEEQYAAVEAASGDQPQRPAHWGGYRLVPERVAQGIEGVAVARVVDAPVRHLYAVWASSPTPAARAFLELMEQHLAGND